MCGICGLVKYDTHPPDLELLLRMMGRLKHRGPDAGGYYRDRQAALGHTRLSIIDLVGGSQPLCNEDQSLWVSFNGEIFNYLELTTELQQRGHRFTTKSDTETIVHAYEEWGTDCFCHFNGQWAIALWDKKTQSLILSRDRVGIRPLYYCRQPRGFLFASEIKAILADPAVQREFDYKGLDEIFTFWSTVAPRTTFKGVSQLQPGHYAILQDQHLRIAPYWQLDFPVAEPDSTPLAENSERFRESLIASTRLRFTRSDVPVGAYLSGGLDSSVTSSIITRYTDSPLKTFSIRFQDTEFDEGSFQQTMADQLATEHESIAVSTREIGQVFPQVIWHTERPILRTAPAPLFLLSRLVRAAGYKVVVTGEGADEVMAGYDIFREMKVRQFLSRDPLSRHRPNIFLRLYPWMERAPGNIPAFAKSFFKQALYAGDPGFSHRPRWNTTTGLKLLCTAEFQKATQQGDITSELLARLPGHYQQWDSLSRAQWLEMTTLLAGYILEAQGDRMLMANSVEGRFPFLDCDFIKFASQLPARHKLAGLEEKFLLKYAFRNELPRAILQRPKQPYRAPDAASFFPHTGLDWVAELTSPAKLRAAGIFNEQAAGLLLRKCRRVEGQKMSNTDNMRLVALLSTMLVYHQFIEQNGRGFCDEKPPQLLTKVDLVSA